MARSIGEIFDQIVEARAQQPGLEALDSSSKMAVWRLWAYVTAVAIASLEQLFDLFKLDVADMLRRKSPGSLPWYRSTAMQFRPGSTLIYDTEGRPVYPNDGQPAIIDQCSVLETNSGLVIKVAKRDGDNLTSLTNDEMRGLVAYMQALKYAGTPIRFISGPAVFLDIRLDIFYDPMVLQSSGQPFNSDNEVAVDAVKNLLKKLPFDGRLLRSQIIETLRAQEGIVDAAITEANTCYDNQAPKPLGNYHIPESGWFELRNILINYIPNV
ncbi:MAG: hypothetical protein IPM52_13160 [Bacteroidetes bacterium]|nr:hypothetical protein [Bacteroidota bacterium]